MSQKMAIEQHLRAIQNLIHSSLDAVKAEDPEAAAGVAAAARNGAFFRVTTSLSTAGLRELEVALVWQDGRSAVLSQAAFDPLR